MKCCFKRSQLSQSMFKILLCSLLVNGNRNLAASTILDKYNIGKVIGDGNFAVVKECVER